ncbi:hypothetical protein BDV96DRAFT_596113 [Lophiotrema nucula]|uniref:Uncharacterized protein n=1 Tax=Lophiotrema nucula TaxID=690887 RepID=A0A6A5ZIW7_9PLEO|nr:hypothetical protein BDV96DRAFT_596113 [Lophiotrema nucula]
MQFLSLALVLATCGMINAFDPRAALAKPHAAADPDAQRTRCTTFVSTVTQTRTRGDVDTSTSTILILQPTTTVVYQTITSLSTYLVTDQVERTRTRTQTNYLSTRRITSIYTASALARVLPQSYKFHGHDRRVSLTSQPLILLHFVALPHTTENVCTLISHHDPLATCLISGGSFHPPSTPCLSTARPTTSPRVNQRTTETMPTHPNKPCIVNKTSDPRPPSYAYKPLPHSHSRHSSVQFQPLLQLPQPRPSTARDARLPSDFMDDEFESTHTWRVRDKTLYPKYICSALLILLVIVLFVASLPVLVIFYHDKPPSEVVAGIHCKTCKVLCKEKGAWLCEKAGCKPYGVEYMEGTKGCFPVSVPKGWNEQR